MSAGGRRTAGRSNRQVKQDSVGSGQGRRVTAGSQIRWASGSRGSRRHSPGSFCRACLVPRPSWIASWRPLRHLRRQPRSGCCRESWGESQPSAEPPFPPRVAPHMAKSAVLRQSRVSPANPAMPLVKHRLDRPADACRGIRLSGTRGWRAEDGSRPGGPRQDSARVLLNLVVAPSVAHRLLIGSRTCRPDGGSRETRYLVDCGRHDGHRTEARSDG